MSQHPDAEAAVMADDIPDAEVFGAPPAGAALHAFPLDDRGVALESARASGFGRTAPVDGSIPPGAPWDISASAGGDAPDLPLQPPASEPEPEPEPEVVYLESSGPVTLVPLTYPFRVGAREVREVRVAPVPMWVQVAFDAGQIETFFALMAAMTGEPAAVIGALRAPDAEALAKAVKAHLTAPMRKALQRMGA